MEQAIDTYGLMVQSYNDWKTFFEEKIPALKQLPGVKDLPESSIKAAQINLYNKLTASAGKAQKKAPPDRANVLAQLAQTKETAQAQAAEASASKASQPDQLTMGTVWGVTFTHVQPKIRTLRYLDTNREYKALVQTKTSAVQCGWNPNLTPKYRPYTKKDKAFALTKTNLNKKISEGEATLVINEENETTGFKPNELKARMNDPKRKLYGKIY